MPSRQGGSQEVQMEIKPFCSVKECPKCGYTKYGNFERRYISAYQIVLHWPAVAGEVLNISPEACLPRMLVICSRCRCLWYEATKDAKGGEGK